MAKWGTQARVKLPEARCWAQSQFLHWLRLLPTANFNQGKFPSLTSKSAG